MNWQDFSQFISARTGIINLQSITGELLPLETASALIREARA